MILDFFFILGSLVVSVLIVVAYYFLSDTKNSFPNHREFDDWLVQAFLDPFKTITNLYGEDSVPAHKDLIGFIIFALVVFITSNVLYFRGAFFTENTFAFYFALTGAFLLIRYIFVSYTLFKNKSVIEQFQPLHRERKQQIKEMKAQKRTLAHLKNREKAIHKLYHKWENTHEKMTTKQDAWQEKIDERKDYLNGKLQTLAYNLEKINHLQPNTIIAIDSNILMKSDEYIIDAISQFPILISKRVQQEWDKNKSSDYGEKAFRARQAIRRLVKLPNYSFTVSKWNEAFLLNNNLLQGVPDDEIIADYLYEQTLGKNIVVLSDDLNFIASCKVHMPVLQLKKLDMFT